MLEHEDIDRLKEIFVTREECTINQNVIDGRVNEINVDLAVIRTQLKTIQWLLTTIGAGVIATLIKLFFGG
jgi:hypothetical protein